LNAAGGFGNEGLAAFSIRLQFVLLKQPVTGQAGVEHWGVADIRMANRSTSLLLMVLMLLASCTSPMPAGYWKGFKPDLIAKDLGD
jgi:hypothetical protein